MYVPPVNLPKPWHNMVVGSTIVVPGDHMTAIFMYSRCNNQRLLGKIDGENTKIHRIS